MTAKNINLHLIFDLDGVMFQGSQVKSGAAELHQWVTSQRIPYHFHTNAGQQSREEIQEKLAGMNILCRKEDITTASESVAAFIKSDFPDTSRAYTIGGGRGLQKELELRNIDPIAIEGLTTHDPHPHMPYPLIIGLSESFDYQMMSKLLMMEHNISTIYSTDNDARFIAGGHLLPGTGWQNAAIAHVLHKDVKSAGKPALWALQYVLSKKLNIGCEHVIVIGDNIYSDIAGGNAMNCRTILVMGGTTKENQLENPASADHIPTYVAQDMTDCYDILQKLHSQPDQK